MGNSKKSYILIFWSLVSFILLICVFKWIGYLAKNFYVVECFKNSTSNSNDISYSNSIDKYVSSTSHSVSLPLTTTYSCKNFCGPTSRCSITGQQCFADVDCPGCQPYSPPLPKNNDVCIPGDDDSGKLTFGSTPQYSPLTSGYGTKQAVITNNVNSKPAEANFGVDTWTSTSNQVLDLYDKRYKPPSNLKYMPSYPGRYSITGDFVDEGPLASNAYL